MKWYDYIVCILIADYLVALLFAGSLFTFVPILFYELYTEMRKQQVEKERNK
jgi:uncharacterized protein YqhQ